MLLKNGRNEIPQEALKLISYCPLCHTYFNLFQAKLIEQLTDIYLLHLECRHCQSSIVMLVLSSDLGVSSFGLVTDLTCEDVKKFKDVSVVSCDDMIELHALLKSRELLNIL